MAYCARCQPARPPFAEWAASLTCNSTVFLQPYAAWRGLSHSTYLVLDRDGDTLTVQMIGIPASRMQVDVAQCADHDVTPRRDWGAAD